MSGGGPVTTATARLSRLKLKRLALLPLLLAVAVPPAVAQQDGVFVDPDSPAGKEYAVPIDQARGDAAGGGDSGSGEEPLFGAGIEPGSGGSADKPRGGEGAGQNAGGSGDRGGEPRQGDGSRDSVDLGQRSVAIEAAAADGSGGLLSAGIAAAVLAGGLLAGFGLRRLLRTG